MRKRGELVERSFQHVLDRGGQRRTQLRGLENVQKSYLLAVAGFNLGLLLRKILGVGTPKRLADRLVGVFCNFGDGTLWLLCFLTPDSTESASAPWFLAIAIRFQRI